MCKSEDDYILDDIFRDLDEKPNRKIQSPKFKEIKPPIINSKEEVKPSITKSIDNQEELISKIEDRFKEASGL